MATSVTINVHEDEEVPKTKEQINKDRIVGILFLTWFIISMAIFVIGGMHKNVYIVIMDFGQFIALFGIGAYISSKDKITLIALVVGLGCIIIPLIMMIGPEEIDWDKILPIIFLALFVIAGLGMIIIPLVNYFKKKKICSVIVPATIVDYDSILHRDQDTRILKTLYAPTYSYTYNGKEYKIKSNTYSDFNLKSQGSLVNLRINPDNPEMFLEPNIFNLIILVTIGTIFFIVSSPILVYLIYCLITNY